MSGFTKKSVDTYIRRRVMNWLYNLQSNAPQYLHQELGLSTSIKDDLTDDDKLKLNAFIYQVTHSLIVTGGTFTSVLQGELPNDVDIYFRDNATAMLVTQYFLARMRDKGDIKETSHISKIEVATRPDLTGITILLKSVGVAGEGIDPDKYEYFEMYPEAYADAFFEQYKKAMDKELSSGASYEVAFMTSNAISLNNGLQFIIRFTGEPEAIHDNFDFIHTTNYWTWAQGVQYNTQALQATLERRMYYFGSRFPVASIFRMRKFIERGWRISAGEMVKIMFDVSQLDLTDITTLREQSIGMDSAYFNQVISILIERGEADLDRSYLFKVLDEVFQLADPHDEFLKALSGSEAATDFNIAESVDLIDIN
jgi:hypothetical protein